MSVSSIDRQWWKEAVVYQIYPRSFNDSNGDGIGDIPGIIEKLDYIDELGVDVVWLNPVYESPEADNGYDISNYRAIMDQFGTMADWEELLEGLHDRDMRLIMDLVVNHVSDEHEWFVKAREDPDSKYRDYFHWAEGRPVESDGGAIEPELESESGSESESESEPESESGSGTGSGSRLGSSSSDTGADSDIGDGADGADPADPDGDRVESDGGLGRRGTLGERPPNNWESFFGGPAWSYDEASDDWYLHIFHEKQPDLNWENPEVREEIFEMMEWWLEKGIDGFRMDVVNLLSKPEGLPDGEDETAIVRGADKFVNGPRIHEYLGEMYDRVLSRYDVMTVGEMVDLDLEEAKRFVGPHGDGMSMAFNFDHMRLDFGRHGRWDRGEWSVFELKRTLTHWQRGLAGEGWNSIYMGNHDEPRMVSRFGDDEEYRRESAKLLATLLMTLQGTPYVFQGDELGMTNYPFSSLDEVRDVDTIRNIEVARQRGRFTGEEEMLELVRHRSRDNARTPMQWTDAPGAGFTDGEPWIPINPNHAEINAEAEREDPDSIFHYYREIIDLRHERDVLVYGNYDLHIDEHDRLWVYSRTLGDEQVLVVLNFSAEETLFVPPDEFDGRGGEVLMSNYDVEDGSLRTRELRPYEAHVYDV